MRVGGVAERADLVRLGGPALGVSLTLCVRPHLDGFHAIFSLGFDPLDFPLIVP